MRTILTVLAAAVLGCGDPLPGDEADSCPAEWEVQSCDVACVSGDLNVLVPLNLCATASSAMCVAGCIKLPDGTSECGCCVSVDEGGQQAMRWELCQ